MSSTSPTPSLVQQGWLGGGRLGECSVGTGAENGWDCGIISRCCLEGESSLVVGNKNVLGEISLLFFFSSLLFSSLLFSSLLFSSLLFSSSSLPLLFLISLQWFCMGKGEPSLGGHSLGGEGAGEVHPSQPPGQVPASLLFLAGTVWMTEILSLIRSRGHPSWSQTVLNSDRMPWFSTRLGLEAALSYPSPRLLTCHLPRHIFPKSFSHSTAKVIYTLRDPRDVVVSYYYFSKMCSSYEDPMSFEQFLRDFLSGELPHGSWFEHVQGWMEMKDQENFFFITYEELKQDLQGSVRRICQFLGQDLDDDAVSSVVRNASFSAMRENPMCSSVLLPADIMDQTKGRFLRKGICGDWKNHFTVAQSETFDRIYQDRMRGLNMAFPWDRR
uniref:Sulfotransferase n=2 Tax=Anser cygnoides TaxID=8845 RepID=A0A8B9E0G5_ANSCY